MILISDLLIYSLVLFCWIFTISLLLSTLKHRSTSKPPARRPPSPPALPIIGHLHLLDLALAKSLQALATKYGPLMRLRFGSKSSIIVSNATIAREILKDNEMNFVSRPDLGSTDYNIFGRYTFVFAEYGTFWRFMKKLCMTELLSTSQVSRFAHLRREEKMKLVETLVDFSQERKACDLGMELLKMTKNVSWRMVMGTSWSSGSEDESKLIWKLIKEAEEITVKLSLGELLGPLGKIDWFGFGRKLKTLLLRVDSMLEKFIVEHEKDIDSDKKEMKDIMDLLLEIYRDENAQVKLTRMHIKSFLWELFLAGTDTTSVALQWTIAELINHPQQLKKLREEINEVVGSRRLVEESDIPNLPYLHAVVKESLRLHPAAALIFRKCEEDCKISGYDILANERILINLNPIMKDPNSWENPLDFVPERFIITSQGHLDHYQMDIRGQNFKNLPFGSGKRGCPGESLALTNIHGVIATLVQFFDFEVEGGKELNMEEKAGFSNVMVHPLLCYPITLFDPLQLINENQ